MPEAFSCRLPRRARRAGFAAALALAGGLTGCGFTDKFPPACPRTSIVAGAADLQRFRPETSGQDLTDLVLNGRITAIAGQCQRSAEDVLEVAVAVRLDLTRGPASTSRVEQVPFFVAVAQGDSILDKRLFQVQAKFPANTDRLRIDSDEIHLSLPITRQKSGAAYDLLVGFQLTPDELATNRRRSTQ